MSFIGYGKLFLYFVIHATILQTHPFSLFGTHAGLRSRTPVIGFYYLDRGLTGLSVKQALSRWPLQNWKKRRGCRGRRCSSSTSCKEEGLNLQHKHVRPPLDTQGAPRRWWAVYGTAVFTPLVVNGLLAAAAWRRRPWGLPGSLRCVITERRLDYRVKQLALRRWV